MSKLLQIQHAVQQVAEAIASVLGVEVTIADEALRRVAGTGRYAGELGDVPIRASVFGQVIRSGQGLVIDNPGQHSACLSCESKGECPEQAQVCCPIKVDGHTIGVIALVAFDQEQRQTLLEQQRDLFGFVDRMADLLASKAEEQERIVALKTVKNQLETVLNAVHEGIMAIDSGGWIVDINAAAQRMTGLLAIEAIGKHVNELFPSLVMEDLLGQGRELIRREMSTRIKGRRLHCVVTFTSWFNSEEVKGVVATIQEMETVKKIASQYSQSIDCTSPDNILGTSEALEYARKVTATAAQTNTAVFIRGESGTGKELFARALHCASERKFEPFVALNCAAIPEALLESELFGYDEGAFTGARKGGKPGKFELADGGTLFLDEIGDMPLPLQAKLLRVLQEKRIERVGGTNSIPVDVRIVSATHKDIEAMVKRGEFRQDLYYRINVFPLIIPPLRERREDLPGLIKHFLEKHRSAQKKEITGIDNEAYSILLSYDWPGNVRELENVIEYLVSIETGRVISVRNVASRIGPQNECIRDILPLAEIERKLILAALARYGNGLEGKEKAAAALGISKATLYRKLREYREG